MSNEEEFEKSQEELHKVIIEELEKQGYKLQTLTPEQLKEKLDRVRVMMEMGPEEFDKAVEAKNKLVYEFVDEQFRIFDEVAHTMAQNVYAFHQNVIHEGEESSEECARDFSKIFKELFELRMQQATKSNSDHAKMLKAFLN